MTHHDESDNALGGPYHMTLADEDALTYDAVPAVDLSIAYSPVLPRWGRSEPTEAIPNVGGRSYTLVHDAHQGYGETVAAWEVNVPPGRSRRLLRRCRRWPRPDRKVFSPQVQNHLR